MLVIRKRLYAHPVVCGILFYCKGGVCVILLAGWLSVLGCVHTELTKQKQNRNCSNSATLMKNFCNHAIWPWQRFVFPATLLSPVAGR